jgi:hypothetical protein
MGLLKDQARAKHVGDRWIQYVPRGGGTGREDCWLAGWEDGDGKGGGMCMIGLWHECCLLYSRVESRYRSDIWTWPRTGM